MSETNNVIVEEQAPVETPVVQEPIKYCDCDDENCLHDYLVEENCGIGDTIENLACYNGAKIRKSNTTFTGEDDKLLCGHDYQVNVKGRLDGDFVILPEVSDMLIGDFKSFYVQPENVTDLVPRIVWMIDDPEVAYVTSEDQVGTYNKEGKFTLTATNLDYPERSASMEINVVKSLSKTEETGGDNEGDVVTD